MSHSLFCRDDIELLRRTKWKNDIRGPNEIAMSREASQNGFGIDSVGHYFTNAQRKLFAEFPIPGLRIWKIPALAIQAHGKHAAALV